MVRRLKRIVLIVWVTMITAVSAAQPMDLPDTIPLLSPGLHVGIVYAPPEDDPAARERLDTVYGEVIQAGASVYQLSISWADLEKTPGQIDTAYLESLLDILTIVNLQPYMVITTINTVRLTLPSDLMTADGYELSDNRHFDDPVITARFARLIDAVVPLLVEHGGFFLSVGNEVEGWLEPRPDEAAGFVRFAAAAREHAHQLEPRLGVGATVGFGGIERQLAFVDDLLAVSDAAVYTYYPLLGDFSVREPSVAAGDLALLVEKAGGLPVLFQEIGYPSGSLPTPHNGSSGDRQRQFVENFFTAVRQYPQVRFVSVIQLSDWSSAVCDGFVEYYTDLKTLPPFHEFLCSLGLRQYDGTPKPAYDAFMAALEELAAPQK